MRKLNITLHLDLESFDREVPGTNAIIALEPTKTNLEKVGKEIGRGIVKDAYIYLVGLMTPGEQIAYLKSLAKDIGDEAGCVRTLQQKNLSFISLNNNLFSLGADLRPSLQKPVLEKGFLSLLKLLQLNPVFLVQNDTKAKSFMDNLTKVGWPDQVHRRERREEQHAKLRRHRYPAQRRHPSGDAPLIPLPGAHRRPLQCEAEQGESRGQNLLP